MKFTSRSLYANFSIRCKVCNQTARLKLEAIIAISSILELKKGKTALISGFGLLL